ncbi:MAG: hypothetical protein HQL53_10830 [Magnetococcales bacterium]|nr:hypothetical protein [Magnetococcales bacterium]
MASQLSESTGMAIPAQERRRLHRRAPRTLHQGVDGFLHRLMGRWQRRGGQVAGFMASASAIVARSEPLAEMAQPKFLEALREGALRLRREGHRDYSVLEGALVLLCEAAWRSMSMRPYPVQLAGALALERGLLAEMGTGEGKSLTVCIPAILAAWRGEPCHVLTANDYLASRDAAFFKPFYELCGLSVSSVTESIAHHQRQSHYRASVVYTTSKELLGDFLRDQLKMGAHVTEEKRVILHLLRGGQPESNGPVLRGLGLALVDEADSVLIDEAVTPLIISAPRENELLVEAAQQALRVSESLERGVHYTLQRRYREVRLTRTGEQVLAQLSQQLPGMWQGEKRRRELIRHALTAREYFKEGEHYVVQDQKVVPLDEFSGRMMPNRNFGIVLHQIVEATAGVEITPPSETLARFSYQKFFRLFPRLAALSGTASEAAVEFWQIFGLATLPVPPHRPCIRRMNRPRCFSDQHRKTEAMVAEIGRLHAQGRPVLVGVRSVNESERLAARIREEGLSCELLNAVRHEEEARIVMEAGGRGRITMATNMAGRGTDIKLDEEVKGLGGLHVIAAEPNDSPRIDRQLYGRASRQGDPGSATLFYSPEDELFRRYLPKPLRRVWQVLIRIAPGALAGPWSHWLLRRTQRSAEKSAAIRRKGVLVADRWLEEFLNFPG